MKALILSSFIISNIAVANERLEFYQPSYRSVELSQHNWAPALPPRKATSTQVRTQAPVATTAPKVETVSVDSAEFKDYDKRYQLYARKKFVIDQFGYDMPGDPITRLGAYQITREQFTNHNRLLEEHIQKMEQEIEYRQNRGLTASQRDTRPREVNTKELPTSRTAKVLKKGASKAGAFAGVAALVGINAAHSSPVKNHVSSDILTADTADRSETPSASVESFGATSFSAGQK